MMTNIFTGRKELHTWHSFISIKIKSQIALSG